MLVFLCLLLSGCSNTALRQKTETSAVTETVTETQTETTTEPTTVDEIQSQLDSMSLDEKIGQMLMPAYRYSGGSRFTVMNEAVESELAEYKIGNVILFDENLASAESSKTLIADFKRLITQNCGIEPFISIDEEGGKVSRLGKSGILSDYYIPSARSMANNGTVKENYTKIALNLKTLGFNMDFAPVADIDTNPANPIIGDRAFSSDPEETAKFMLEAAKTLEDKGIIPVIKHFPGHGDTQTDSHLGIAVVTHDKTRLESVEFVPYRQAVENNIPVVMVGHLTTPQLSNNELPASLNPDIIKGILRDELGFDGVVITDALDMGAAAKFYENEETAVMAVKAGADILLMPPDAPAAFKAVKNAVENGEISRENIDDSVYRILKLKWRQQQ